MATLTPETAVPLGTPQAAASLGTPQTLVEGRTSRHVANDAWEALMTAHASLVRQFNAEEVWEDLSMKEYDVLYTLSKCSNPIRLCELNRHVLLSQPALSRMVDRLTERGLVSRAPDPMDGRVVRLALTEEGLTIQRRIGRRHGRSVAQAMLSGLTPRELRQLEQLCAKLGATADKPRADKPRAGETSSHHHQDEKRP